MRVAVVTLLSAAALAGPARGEFFVCSPPMSLNLFIDKALVNEDDEDVILVHEGTIDEKVVIDYADSNQRSLTIVRTGKRPVITGGVEIRDARELLFQGFKVRSPLNDGIPAVTVSGGTAIRLVDLRGEWLDDGGIDAVDTFELTVDKCRFSGMGKWDPNDSGFGVRIRGRCGHLVRDTITDGNTFRGIWVEAASSVVRDCEAIGNGSGGASAGIYVEGMQNLVKGNVTNGGDGFGVFAVGDCRVRKNEARENERAGIRYGDESVGVFHGGEIRDNVVRDNDGDGVLVKASQLGCAVSRNDVRDNRGAGIRLAGGSCLVSENDVRDTSKSAGDDGHAILVESDENLLVGNVFSKNEGSAIRVTGGANYLFENKAKQKGAFVDASTGGNDGRDNETKGKNDFP